MAPADLPWFASPPAWVAPVASSTPVAHPFASAGLIPAALSAPTTLRAPPYRALLVLHDQLVELNRATQADLESLPGIGPALSERLLAERQRRAFSGWLDLVSRVKGVGWHGGLRLSRSGLRIEGLAHPEDRSTGDP